MRQYQAMNLSKPASVRDATTGKYRKHPKASERRSPYFYRDDKPRALGRDGFGGYLNSRGDEISEAAPCALRVYACHEFKGNHGRSLIEHEGWFADDDCIQTIYGIVVRLPRSRGFLAGWAMGAGMCASVDPHIYDCERDAVYAADSTAERTAESERDYHAKCDARRRIDEARERILELREEHSELIAAIRDGHGDDAIGARTRERLRDAVSEQREAIRDAIREHGEEILTDEFAS